MIWSLDTDGPGERSLLAAIHDELQGRNGAVVPAMPSTGR
jgi:hypothetical protein